MGHAVEYYTTDKKSEIIEIAKEFAFYNTDRGENPTGSYHGNMTVHDRPICESYEDAVERISEWDTGWYSDHAVQYKDKSKLKPTKQMESLKAKEEKLRAERKRYIDKHSLKERKAEFIGCSKCESKIAKKYLMGNRCPVCGTDLRAGYILERVSKYDTDIAETKRQYAELQKKQSGKCPVRWLVKVEVHC